MKIRALRVRNIGPFGEEGCALKNFDDGLNVIREKNEAGKSTLFAALQTVLFEKHSSKKADLRDLRHDRGGGAPFIELDLQVGDRVLRISKQYLSTPSAVVTDVITGARLKEAREAEDWIAELIGGDKPDEGPSGMLWIRQGDAFLQPKPEGSAGEALFSALEGEVDLVMGGHRAARVLDQAQKRLSEIVSTAKLSPKGAYRDALTRLEELDREQEALSIAVRQSESDRQKLLNVLTERDALTTDDDDLFAQEISAARKELEAAEGASEKIRVLTSTANALCATLQASEKELERYQTDLKNAERLRTELAGQQADVARIVEQIVEREPVLTTLRRKADDAHALYIQARKAHTDATLRNQHRQAFEKRQSIDKALQRAKEITQKVQAISGTLTAQLPGLSDLDAANQALLKCEAEARVARPVLTVLKSGAPVHLNDTEIGRTETVRLSGQTTLSYQDLEIRIDTPDTQGTEEKLASAKARLQTLLVSCNAPDIAAARRLHEMRNVAQTTVSSLKTELKSVAPNGLADLENALALLPASVVNDAAEPQDLDTLSRNSERAEEALASITSERDAAIEGIRKQRGLVTILETRIEGLESQLRELETFLGTDAERDTRKSALNEAVVEARRRSRDAQDRVSEAERERPSLEAAQARVRRLETAAQNRSKDRLRLSAAEGELRGRLAQAGQDGAADKLAAIEAEIVRWKERVSAFEAERDALVLLVDELSKARSSRRTKFFAPVRQAVDPLLSMVLGDASLAYDDGLGPDELERNGTREKLTRLSGGTREQIAVLTRLGFAQVMAAKGRHVPIVLDDALVYSDDDRIQKLFDAINVVANDVQIIAFSCRQKTFEAIGGNAIHPVPYKR